VVRSELKLSFFDGSLDDETTVYSQARDFILISDHPVQSGPSFPKPPDVTVDARKNPITTISPSGEIKRGLVQTTLDC